MVSPRLVSVLVTSWLVAAGGASDLDYGLYNIFLNSDKIKCNFSKSLNLDVSEMRLFVYDFESGVNSTYYMDEAAGQLLASPGFDPTRRFIVFVHGFGDTGNGSSYESVLQNLKRVPHSYILFPDHHKYSNLSSVLEFVASYERAVRYYWDIGRGIAEFLINLVTGGVAVDLIHVIGHSLGGQIIGAVGEYYYNRTGVFLPRLTASDPAGPCFNKADPKYHIRSGVASFVELYHCDAGELGTTRDLCDANFYVNGGQNQPGCLEPPVPDFLLSFLASTCSHGACPKIYTFPARQKYIYQAVKCDTYDNFKRGRCSTNETTIAGYRSPSDAAGKYYFETTGFHEY